MELIRRITKGDLFARLESINGVLLFFSKTVLTFALSAHLLVEIEKVLVSIFLVKSQSVTINSELLTSFHERNIVKQWTDNKISYFCYTEITKK